MTRHITNNAWHATEASDRPLSNPLSKDSDATSSFDWPTNRDEYAIWSSAFAVAKQPPIYEETVFFNTGDLYSGNRSQENGLQNLNSTSRGLRSEKLDGAMLDNASGFTGDEVRSAASKKSRAQVFDNIHNTEPGGLLSQRDGKKLGDWLAKNLGKIDGANMTTPVESGDDLNLPDGKISFDELKAIYANGQWPDGTKLSREDALMLKQAAFYFDHYSHNKGNIGRAVIEDLQAGARFSKIKGIDTATRPDGTTTQYTELGLMRRLPDGTRIITPNSIDSDAETTITMRPDGTGTIKSTFLGARGVSNELQMRQGKDGSWKVYEQDGTEYASLDFKPNGDFSMTTADGDGYSFTTDANGEKKMTITEAGKVVSETNLTKKETDTTDDEGNPVKLNLGPDDVAKLTTQDGSTEYALPDDTTVRRPAGGGIQIDAAGEDIRVEIGADGTTKVFNREGNEIKTSRNPDGTIVAREGDVRVKIKPSGLIDIAFGTGDGRTNVVVVGNTVFSRVGNGTPSSYRLF